MKMQTRVVITSVSGSLHRGPWMDNDDQYEVEQSVITSLSMTGFYPFHSSDKSEYHSKYSIRSFTVEERTVE